MEIDLENRVIERGSLALTLSSAVHLVLPVSFLSNGYYSIIIALFISLGISRLHGRCLRQSSSPLALWFCQLHCSAWVASVSRSIAQVLYALDVLRMRHLMPNESIASPALAFVACTSVSVLCALGLERSGLLRFLLGISIFATPIFIFLGSDWRSYIDKETSNTTDPILSVSSVSHSTLLMLGGFVPTPASPGKPSLLPVQVSLPDNYLIACLCLFVAGICRLIYGKRGDIDGTSVSTLLMDLFNVGWKKLTLAILQTLSLGLSLPELVLGSAACTLRLCGRVLPRWLAKETLYTGTHVPAFIFSGIISSVLCCALSVSRLVELFCFAYLFSDWIDAILNLFKRYQPSFYHKERGKSSEIAQYEMLATSDSMFSDFEGDERLSEDSGHSSDTDIDAAVAEFKDNVKVVSSITDPIVLEPTPSSGRKSLVCLSVSVTLFLLSGILLKHSLLVPCLVTILGGIGSLIVQYFLPSRQFVSNETHTWLLCSCILCDSLLICQVSLDILLSGVVWLIAGQLLVRKFGSSRLQQMP